MSFAHIDGALKDSRWLAAPSAGFAFRRVLASYVQSRGNQWVMIWDIYREE